MNSLSIKSGFYLPVVLLVQLETSIAWSFDEDIWLDSPDEADPLLVPSSDEPVDIANNLLAQASLLEEDAKALVSDAEAKKSEAYRIAPELSPKRGPGRPPKNS